MMTQCPGCCELSTFIIIIIPHKHTKSCDQSKAISKREQIPNHACCEMHAFVCHSSCKHSWSMWSNVPQSIIAAANIHTSKSTQGLGAARGMPTTSPNQSSWSPWGLPLACPPIWHGGHLKWWLLLTINCCSSLRHIFHPWRCLAWMWCLCDRVDILSGV